MKYYETGSIAVKLCSILRIRYPVALEIIKRFEESEGNRVNLGLNDQEFAEYLAELVSDRKENHDANPTDKENNS